MIHETIITTLNVNGTVHMAPMGIRHEQARFVISPFKPSTTLENLRRSGQAVINFTDDVRIFAGCLTGRSDWPLKPASVVAGQVLEAALSHVEVEVEEAEEDTLRPRFFCREMHRAVHGAFRGFNRGQAAVVEAAILVSRLDRLPREKVDRELGYLQIAVDKTAGDRERTAWNWLMEWVDEHRRGAARERASK